MISDDEYLERIVAGIHAVTTADAEVRWNEIINGRQFDVVVRFKLGSLRYIVLIEVRNRTRKAAASDMDAFVLKARDQIANKAVFVTTAGFQNGAISVAKRHGVDLFTVTFDEAGMHFPAQASFFALRKKEAPKEIPLTVSIGEPTLIANVENVTLVYADGERFEMPDEQSQLNYYAKKTALQDGRTLNDVIQQAPLGQIKLDESRRDEIRLDPPQRIEPPDDYFFPTGVLASLECVVTGRQGRPIKGNTLIDPNTFMFPVIYTNVITGETSRFAIDQLPLGVKRVSVGGFYFIPHPLMYYYCAAIEGDKVRWYLIESFQNGEKVTAKITQDIKYSPYYIPVSDKKILGRLKMRLDNFLKVSMQ
ncbi:MAG: restriction endonuclease [Rhodospirillales bacterium]|nr:restriction endonuclease [Rhodospirillales bacterium]